jgi:hypothetical protein
MNIVRGAVRAVTEAANATTATAGAVGGAAINGVIGGVQGTIGGIRSGMSSGSHSTPAALLTIGAIGATGLVDWPVLLMIGGTAIVLRQLHQREHAQPSAPAPPSSQRVVPIKAQPRASATSASRAAATSASRTPPRKTASRRATKTTKASRRV